MQMAVEHYYINLTSIRAIAARWTKRNDVFVHPVNLVDSVWMAWLGETNVFDVYAL